MVQHGAADQAAAGPDAGVAPLDRALAGPSEVYLGWGLNMGPLLTVDRALTGQVQLFVGLSIRGLSSSLS